jgi:hypothetical protein
MTSKIKVDNINKVSDDSNIINKSGTTITLGASGDTINLASGASQSGFGRTGTVDWQTTKITADPGPAVSGKGYFTDTSGAAFNVTLPSSPSAGDIVAVADYANTWDNNAVTIVRNGSNIEGDADNLICNIEGSSITLVYVDATKGWITVNSGNSDQAVASLFINATGGTITNTPTCRIHTFTGPGSFTVNAIASVCGPTRNNVSYLVVAGGASGGESSVSGGGGGAGGFREYKAPLTPYTASPLDGNPCGTSITLAAGTYPITIGGGGSGGGGPNGCSAGNNGQCFNFINSITAAGGGGGAAYWLCPRYWLQRVLAGSGGGHGAGAGVPGGAGNTPPTNPGQGFNGGPAGCKSRKATLTGGGGGGATGAGGKVQIQVTFLAEDLLEQAVLELQHQLYNSSTCSLCNRRWWTLPYKLDPGDVAQVGQAEPLSC